MATRIYKVKKGDNILTVCLMFKLTYDRFIELNPQFGPTGYRSVDKLHEGELLVVGIDPLDLVKEKKND